MRKLHSKRALWPLLLGLTIAFATAIAYRAWRAASHGRASSRLTPGWVNKLSAARPKGPNILLVVYDARRRDDFSFGRFGNRRGDTPFLQEFSQSSLLFEDAVAPGCWTIPVHAAMFSGLSVCQLGIDRYNVGSPGFGTQFLSLAEILSLAGYRTIAYADHPFFYNEAREISLIRGFDQFSVVHDFQRYGTYTNVGTRNATIEHRHPFEGLAPLSAAELDDAIRHSNEEWLPPREDQADFDARDGIWFPKLAALYRRSEYFQRRYSLDFDRHLFPPQRDDRPFFLFLNLHMCLAAEPDPALFHRFFLQTLLLNAAHRRTRLEAAAGEVGVPNCLVRNFERLGLSRSRFANPWQFVKQAFDNRFYDATFERLWQYLSQRGLTRNTVTVVTSDHGLSLGEHGEPLFLHDGARPYEYLTRVPLVVRFPEGSELARRHGRRPEKVSLLDVFPTVVELALGPGVFERELPIMGRSLVRRIDRHEFESVLVAESSLLPALSTEWSEVAGYAKAVYWGDFKLLAAPASYRRTGNPVWPLEARLRDGWPFPPPRPPYQRLDRPLTLLYDLVRDPHERRNLAEERPDVVERLHGLVGNAWACEPVRAAEQAPRWQGEAQETLRALGYVH